MGVNLLKAILICLVTFCFLLSIISIANADVLRVEPVVSYNSLKIDGGTTPDYAVAKPILMLGINSDTDLKFIRLGLDLGYGNIEDFSCLTIIPRAGWEFGILDYKIKIYESYKILNLTDHSSSTLTHGFSGFVLGTEIESKISEMFAWTGALTIPETCSYYRNGALITDGGAPDSISQSDWSIGLKFSPLPLYDILIKYHASQIFDQDQNLIITLKGITASVNFTF
jgi:hypothetical protein